MKKIVSLLIAGGFLLQVQYSRAQRIIGIGPVSITVAEMERSLDFYTKVLHFEKMNDREVYGEPYEKLENLFGLRLRIVTLKLGDEEIELVDYLTTGGRSIPEDAKSNDLSFQHLAIVVSDMEKAYQVLRDHHVVHVSTGPQTLPESIPAASGVKAFYFLDPDKHTLELIWFPKGKGQQKWQQDTDKLFLGIDHTAFGVSNTTNSLKFYRDLLGIERKGDSYNKGIEQQHLNNVEGATLHITGLRTSAGPGLEFLQYLVPGPGSPYPADTRADDTWNWQTTLIADNAVALYHKIKDSDNYTIVSRELLDIPDKDGRSSKTFIVRDEDGHAMVIKEK